MNNGRDCPHGRQVGKCDTCDFITTELELEKAIAERDALAAQVEALKISDSDLHALVEDLIDHLRYNKRESTDVLEVYWDRLSAIQTTQISPQQHLAEIRAQAVMDAVANLTPWKISGKMFHLVDELAQYADSIRRGEVK